MSIPILSETWEKDRPWRKFLTEKEMKSLHPTALVMADYWTKWLPKTCKRIQNEGTNLKEYFDKKGEKFANLLIDLMQQGLAEDQAWEIVKEEMFLPPEE